MNCYNTGRISASGKYFGGMIGYISGSVQNCFSFGDNISKSDYSGSICGSAYKIQNCYCKGATDTDIGDGTFTKTDAQFSSGEVTYLLNNGENNGTQKWYQTVNNGLPDFSGATVYKYDILNCDGSEKSPIDRHYTNTITSDIQEDHDFENTNGICSGCHMCQPARLTTNEYDVDGNDGKDTVYEISNAGQLYWFATQVNTANTSINGILKNNISLNDESFTFNPDTGLVEVSDGIHTAYLGTGIPGDKSGSNEVFDESESTAADWYKSEASKTGVTYQGDILSWQSIGKDTGISYEGYFDGNGKTISGLYQNGPGTPAAGLFGESIGVISNLVLSDCFICEKRDNTIIGGVCGINSGRINSCTFQGTVIGCGYAGGICGCNDSPLLAIGCIDCTNNGTVIGLITDSGLFGGVCGNLSSGTLKGCCNKGRVLAKVMTDVELSAASKTGGIVGQVSSGSINACYNLGIVRGSFAGGVCGKSSGVVKNSYDTGTVTGTYVGSICVTNAGEINNCGRILRSQTEPLFFISESGKAYGLFNCTEEQARSGYMTWRLNEEQAMTVSNQVDFVQGENYPVPADSSTKTFLGASLSLSDSVGIGYFIKKAGESTAPTLKIYNEDGVLRAELSAIKNTESNESYKYSFNDIAIKEVGDSYYAICEGSVLFFGAADYCYSQLENQSSSRKLKTLCADLLVFAAEAQEYFDYKTSNLVTNRSTLPVEENRTKEEPETASFLENSNVVAGYRIEFARLKLEDTVQLEINYIVPSCQTETTYNVSIERTDGTFDYLSITVPAGSTKLSGLYKNLGPLEMREKIKISLYDETKSTRLSNVTQYSIESYADFKIKENEKAKELVIAMMKYGDSACIYTGN